MLDLTVQSLASMTLRLHFPSSVRYFRRACCLAQPPRSLLLAVEATGTVDPPSGVAIVHLDWVGAGLGNFGRHCVEIRQPRQPEGLKGRDAIKEPQQPTPLQHGQSEIRVGYQKVETGHATSTRVVRTAREVTTHLSGYRHLYVMALQAS